jgi:Na+-driven multidrug efflux pump
MFLPFWRTFSTFLNPIVEIVNHSRRALSILIIPYILLALNPVTYSIFSGIGKTKYMAISQFLRTGSLT